MKGNAITAYQDIQNMSLDAFVERFPDPVLHVSIPDEEVDTEPRLVDFQTRVVNVAEVFSFGGRGRAFPVRKAPGSFGEAIWIGRASNCDVVIRLPTLSKVHAMIKRLPDESFLIGDLGSKNGTTVDGQAIAKGQLVPLGDGAQVTMGQLKVRFLLPRSFYEELRRKAADRP